MPRLLPHLSLLWLSLTVLLSGCGATSSSRSWEEEARDAASACEDPGADQCVVLACDGEAGDSAWFRAQGLNPHDWTMVIPEHVHLRVHRNGARGGLWNQAWRDFKDANQGRAVPPAELLAKAFELASRFDIVGPIVPYGHTLISPGPQMFAP